MGGGAALLYAGTFPEKVKKLALIDVLKPAIAAADDQPERTSRSIEQLLQAEALIEREPLHYEFEMLIDKMMKSYMFKLTPDAAKTLASRGSTKHQDGLYSFSHDPRVKVPNIIGITFEQEKAYTNRVQCEMLFIKATRGIYAKGREMYDEILKVYEEKTKKFSLHEVEGDHHVHLNNPEAVAPLLIQFFSS